MKSHGFRVHRRAAAGRSPRARFRACERQMSFNVTVLYELAPR